MTRYKLAFVLILILLIVVATLIKTKIPKINFESKIDIQDISVDIYSGKSKGSPKLFYEYFQDSNLEKHWSSVGRQTNLTYKQNEETMVDVVIKNNGLNIYDDPKFLIESDMPFYILTIDYYGYLEFTKINFTDISFCGHFDYRGCLNSVQLDGNLPPLTRVKFNIGYGYRLKTEIPLEEYPFQYTEKYGHGNETYFDRPWPFNTTKELKIYMDGTLIHIVNVMFN